MPLEICLRSKEGLVSRPARFPWEPTPVSVNYRLDVNPSGILGVFDYSLLAVGLRGTAHHPDGWELADVSLVIDNYCVQPYPKSTLLRYSEDEDANPTGVAPFEVPVGGWDVVPMRTETWWVTLRGLGRVAE